MTYAFQSMMKNLGIIPAAATVSLLLFAAVPSSAQQDGSLAAAARQARSEKQPSADASQAQSLIDAMVEEEQGGNAPAGMKQYKGDGYTVVVPSPYQVESRDGAGTLLAAGQWGGGARMYVLAGNPMVASWGNSDDGFRDAALQFLHLYTTNTSCTKSTVADHPAYECGLSAAHLGGTSVSGSAEFVRSGGYVYPVLCAAKTESAARDAFNSPRSSWGSKADAQDQMQREDEQVRAAWKKCETVLKSIQIAEKTAAPGPKTAPASTTRPAARSDATGTQTTAAKSAVQTSGAQSAQPAANPQAGAAPSANISTESSVPAGFKVVPFTYCKSANSCWNASVYVPAAAKQVSSACNQFVFETSVKGAPFVLLAGSAGTDCGRSNGDPSLVRWKELADPESARAPGTFNTISTLQAMFDGKPGLITQIGFRKGLTEWMGRRAELDSNGVPLVVGCMSERAHFADGDDICSSLISSLRLP